MSLQKRIDDETKSATWSDIFTPEERQQYIDLNAQGRKEEAKKLFNMAMNRGERYPL